MMVEGLLPVVMTHQEIVEVSFDLDSVRPRSTAESVVDLARPACQPKDLEDSQSLCTSGTAGVNKNAVTGC